jgi:hypothetical protein
MLAQALRSAAAPSSTQGALGMMLSAIRGLSSSTAAAQQGIPTYTYTPPGSSVSDPAYGGGHGLSEVKSQPMSEVKILRPSKKAQWLKLSTKHARELESQSQKPGAMLPPGCSISDPHYSMRDPVYFVDKQ